MNATRHHDMAAVTLVMQDYLKAIYKLRVEAVPVATQHITDRLEVASPSVCRWCVGMP